MKLIEKFIDIFSMTCISLSMSLLSLNWFNTQSIKSYLVNEPQPNLIEKYRIKINGSTITLESAENDLQRLKGLSFREKLDENKGMLFKFDDEKNRDFWMVDMKFPLDIIFVDSNRLITNIYENVQPCLNIYKCPFYSGKAKFVIELNKGLAKNLKVGQKIEIEEL